MNLRDRTSSRSEGRQATAVKLTLPNKKGHRAKIRHGYGTFRPRAGRPSAGGKLARTPSLSQRGSSESS